MNDLFDLSRYRPLLDNFVDQLTGDGSSRGKFWKRQQLKSEAFFALLGFWQELNLMLNNGGLYESREKLRDELFAPFHTKMMAIHEKFEIDADYSQSGMLERFRDGIGETLTRSVLVRPTPTHRALIYEVEKFWRNFFRLKLMPVEGKETQVADISSEELKRQTVILSNFSRFTKSPSFINPPAVPRPGQQGFDNTISLKKNFGKKYVPESKLFSTEKANAIAGKMVKRVMPGLLNLLNDLTGDAVSGKMLVEISSNFHTVFAKKLVYTILQKAVDAKVDLRPLEQSFDAELDEEMYLFYGFLMELIFEKGSFRSFFNEFESSLDRLIMSYILMIQDIDTEDINDLVQSFKADDDEAQEIKEDFREAISNFRKIIEFGIDEPKIKGVSDDVKSTARKVFFNTFNHLKESADFPLKISLERAFEEGSLVDGLKNGLEQSFRRTLHVCMGYSIMLRGILYQAHPDNHEPDIGYEELNEIITSLAGEEDETLLLIALEKYMTDENPATVQSLEELFIHHAIKEGDYISIIPTDSQLFGATQTGKDKPLEESEIWALRNAHIAKNPLSLFDNWDKWVEAAGYANGLVTLSKESPESGDAQLERLTSDLEPDIRPVNLKTLIENAFQKNPEYASRITQVPAWVYDSKEDTASYDLEQFSEADWYMQEAVPNTSDSAQNVDEDPLRGLKQKYLEDLFATIQYEYKNLLILHEITEWKQNPIVRVENLLKRKGIDLDAVGIDPDIDYVEEVKGRSRSTQADIPKESPEGSKESVSAGEQFVFETADELVPTYTFLAVLTGCHRIQHTFVRLLSRQIAGLPEERRYEAPLWTSLSIGKEILHIIENGFFHILTGAEPGQKLEMFDNTMVLLDPEKVDYMQKRLHEALLNCKEPLEKYIKEQLELQFTREFPNFSKSKEFDYRLSYDISTCEGVIGTFLQGVEDILVRSEQGLS